MKMKIKKTILLSIICLIQYSCSTQAQESVSKNTEYKVLKTEQEWKNQLTTSEFNVLRNKGTEAPGSGIFNKHYEDGIYTCKGCNEPLFKSKNKFNSYSGWPSFDAAIKGKVNFITDGSHGMIRTEITCASCDGHLGHVFNDGPRKTTGKRFCVNSVSLNFEKK